MPTDLNETEQTVFAQALSDWLRVHARDPSGVKIVAIAGRRCVVKRRVFRWFDPLVYLARFLRSFTLSLLCRLVWGERPVTKTLLQNGLDDEARRLSLLAKAGRKVPAIYHHSPGVLVLEFVGEDLPHLLRKSDRAGRIAWMVTVADDLADFHRAGFIHGGAQLRNLMYQCDRLTRIDFEENIGEALSLPLGHAYDVYQMLSSLAGMRADEIDRTERQLLCNRLLQEYLLVNPDLVVRRYLTNLARAFRGVVIILGPILRQIPGKDVQGFLYVSQTLRLILLDE